MTQLRISPLVLLTAVSLSCGVLPERAAVPGDGALPAVSAPPPAPPAAKALPAEVAAVVRELEGRHTGLSRDDIRQLASVIVDEAHRQAIPLDLVLAVMHVESGYYNFAVSHVGALGLMQVMPRTGEESAAKLGIPWNGPRTLFDPQVNVRIGIWYLRHLHDRYGQRDAALAAYNWGPHRIDWRLRNGRALPKLYPTQVREALETRLEPELEAGLPSARG